MLVGLKLNMIVQSISLIFEVAFSRLKICLHCHVFERLDIMIAVL